MKLTSNYADLLFNEAANDEWCEFIAGKIRSIVQDPAVAELLIPQDHRFGEKRPPFVAGYFEAFNDPKVSLVDLRSTPMVRLTETGIETTDGLREFDIIVWATGFDFGTGALLRMGIEGRDGLALADHWADGPTTFLGLQTRGFPNLFFPGGPHAAAGNNPRYNGDQVDFVTEILVEARRRGADVVEVSAESEERWTRMVDKGAAKTTFGTIGQYVGGNIPGKPRRYLLNTGGRPKLFEIIAATKADDYAAFELSQPAEPAAHRELTATANNVHVKAVITLVRRPSRATRSRDQGGLHVGWLRPDAECGLGGGRHRPTTATIPAAEPRWRRSTPRCGRRSSSLRTDEEVSSHNPSPFTKQHSPRRVRDRVPRRNSRTRKVAPETCLISETWLPAQSSTASIRPARSPL